MTRTNRRHGPRGQGASALGNGEFNAHLPERFGRRQHNDHVTKPKSENNDSGAMLLSYSKRLQAYHLPSNARTDSENWMSMPEFPVVQELVESTDDGDNVANRLDPMIFNTVDKPWHSKAQYLEHHYRLLRENAIQPLRAAVQTVMENLEAKEPATGSIGIYDDVHITRMTFANRGIGVRVSFTLRRVGKQVKWNQSKRLTPGSLVVLIPAKNRSLGSIRVAVVASKALSIIDKEPPEVDLFFAQPHELEIDAQTKWIMVEERSGLFEAERYTLLALQKMMRESFPLSKQIVELQQCEKPPQYVVDSPMRDLGSVIASDVDLSVPRNILTDWPTQPSHLMDKSQQNALKRMLTEPLVLVQGPPGTGKTFVSTQALDAMLSNMKDDDPPIVIACQTNHALDQILRKINSKKPDCFVRLGSRSTDQEIAQNHTLFQIRSNMKIPRSQRRRSGRMKIQELSKRMIDLLKPFQKGAGVLTLDYLQQVGILNDSQCSSIRASAKCWQSAGTMATKEIDLENWVGVELKPLEQQTSRFVFPEIEETELDMEELNEQEAENCAFASEEELDLLTGSFIELGDEMVGAEKPKLSGSAKTSSSIAEIIDNSSDMGKINPKMRGSVYNHLVERAKALALREFREMATQYWKAVHDHAIGKHEEDAFVLDRYKIIGVTTTGFSKYRSLIDAVQPRIVFIEEAAETLEAPLTATCINSLQQLVLVGDHRQLRPRCNSRYLKGEPFNLDISMFERLISNEVQFSLLTTQRRMIPGVRRLLQPFYGSVIEDDALVRDKTNRPPIPGMGKKSVWFYTHCGPEAKDDQLSYYNLNEAAMIVEFVRYLFFNHVQASDITVLTFYNGQKRKIKTCIRKRLGNPGSLVQVVTVDSYQGEENGIILLSLVRNNARGNIGFLSVENRVCVALSRAQRALYIFGNGELLCGESKAWSDIIKILYGLSSTDRRRIGYTIPLQCEKHKRKTWIANLQDWEQYAGGCDMRCEQPMSCGHVCAGLCHDSDRHDCKKLCGRRLPCSHPCQEKCIDVCRCRECEGKAKAHNRGRQYFQNISPRQGGGYPSGTSNRSSESDNSSTKLKSSGAWNDFANGDVLFHDEALQHERKETELNYHRQYFDEINQELLFGSNPISSISDFKDKEPEIRSNGKNVYRSKCRGQIVEDILNLPSAENEQSLLD